MIATQGPLQPRRMPISARLEAMPGVWQVHVRAPDLARRAAPGRFFMALQGSTLDPYLRTPLPIHHLGQETIAFLLDERVPEHRWLCQRDVGERVDMLGPLGKGYGLAPGSSRVLLIAQGLGIAPLVALAQAAVAEGRQVTLLALADRKERLYPAGLLPGAVEYHTLVGEAAVPWEPLLDELLPWADQIGAAGDAALYRLLARRLAADPLQARPGRCQVYLFGPMACGCGLCQACGFQARRGMRQVCTDGPVFDLDTLDM